MEQTKEIEQHELHRQLELQRQYLDFLANTVEYLSQELSKVTKHLHSEPISSCTWYETKQVIGRPLRPAQLGEAPIVSQIVPCNFLQTPHPQGKKHNLGG